MGCGNTHKKNRITPVTRKHICKKKYIVKKKNIRITYELKLKNSNIGRRKDCRKKVIKKYCRKKVIKKYCRKKISKKNCRKKISKKNCRKKSSIVCPLRRKKGRKKVILIRKKFIRGPRGIQGPTGPRGIQGPAGPRGIQGPPGPPGSDIIPDIIILPSAQRYFYIMTSDTQSLVTIPANEFTNDEGTFITAFTDIGQNSYSNLYINGILQEGSLYSLNESALTINLNDQTIFSGTPIILEIIQFFAQVPS